MVDAQPPVIVCPDNIVINIYTGNTSTIVSWKSVESSDNSGQDVIVVGSHSSGEQFLIGSTVVTYSAKDTSDNSAMCTFNVTVKGMYRD